MRKYRHKAHPNEGIDFLNGVIYYYQGVRNESPINFTRDQVKGILDNWDKYVSRGDGTVEIVHPNEVIFKWVNPLADIVGYRFNVNCVTGIPYGVCKIYEDGREQEWIPVPGVENLYEGFMNDAIFREDLSACTMEEIFDCEASRKPIDSKYNSACPKCGASCYLGFSSIECSNSNCDRYVQPRMVIA